MLGTTLQALFGDNIVIAKQIDRIRLGEAGGGKTDLNVQNVLH